MTARGFISAAALLASAACLEEKRTPVDFTERIERVSVSASDTTGRPAPVAPRAADPPPVLPGSRATAEVTLAPRTAAGIQGALRLRGNGGSTVVAASLVAQQAGTYDGAIQQGTCDHPGARVASLNPVTIDSAGPGRSATFVSMPIDTLLARAHALVFGRGGRAESCGELGPRS